MRNPAGQNVGHLEWSLEPSGECRLTLALEHRARKVSSRVRETETEPVTAPLSSYANFSEKHESGRVGYGKLPSPRSYTKYAKRKLRNCVGAISASHRRGNIRFVTITLAASTDEAMRVFASYSAQFVDTMVHHWRYHVPQLLYCYKWEWQKRGALHLHAVIASPDESALKRFDAGLKKYVADLFHALSEKTGVDMFARKDGDTWANRLDVLRVRSERIRKSVKRYMAKYISKEAGAALGYFPSTWWGAGDALRERVAQMTRRVVIRSDSAAKLEGLRELARELSARKAPVWFSWTRLYSQIEGTDLFFFEETTEGEIWESICLVLENAQPDLHPCEWVPRYQPSQTVRFNTYTQHIHANNAG